MANPSSGSLPLWLDEALSGWSLPLAGLAVVLVCGALFFFGLMSESACASVVVVAVGLGVGLYLLRPALDPRRDGASRVLAAAAAAVTMIATVVPALATVHPGSPLFTGDLAQVDDAIPVPQGVSGAVRLLIQGQLPERGQPDVTYTIAGTKDPIEGEIRRTFRSVRVGRSGRAQVAQDHTADMYPARLPAGAPSLKLDRLQGQLESPLHVSVYREPVPVPGGAWTLAILALLLASIAEARMGVKSDPAVASGMALAFSLLVTYNATPAVAVGPAIGGLVLGAIVGSLVGWIVGAIVRKFVPVAKKKQAPRVDGQAVA